MSNVRSIGLDVHAQTIAVAVAEPDGDVRSLGVIPEPAGVDLAVFFEKEGTTVRPFVLLGRESPVAPERRARHARHAVQSGAR